MIVNRILLVFWLKINILMQFRARTDEKPCARCGRWPAEYAADCFLWQYAARKPRRSGRSAQTALRPFCTLSFSALCRFCTVSTRLIDHYCNHGVRYRGVQGVLRPPVFRKKTMNFLNLQ